jgi:hypothetical protein
MPITLSQRPRAESSPRIANALTTLLPEPGSARHHGAGFWVVALTFLTLAAFTTVPSPLYALYQANRPEGLPSTRTVIQTLVLFDPDISPHEPHVRSASVGHQSHVRGVDP